MNKKIKEILLVVMAFIVGIYLFELSISFGYFFITENINNNGGYHYNGIEKNISKIKTYKLLKRTYEELYLSMYPSLFIKQLLKDNDSNNIIPLGGKSNSKTLLCNELNGPIVYNSDKFGFRNKVYSKQTDIVIVGDSFAHGFCVNNGLAENLIQFDINVINLGMQGNGPLLSYATAREYNINSKYLVYVYHENDLDDLDVGKKTYLSKYLDINFTQNLKNKQNQIDMLLLKFHNKSLLNRKTSNLKRSFSFLPEKIRSLVVLHKTRAMIKALFFEQNDRNYDLATMRVIFNNFKLLAQSFDQEFIVVFTPEISRYVFKLDNEFKSRAHMLALLNELNIQTIDFHKILKDKYYENIYDIEGSGHYSNHGYLLLAKQVKDELNL
jgi:hypothetical protein